MKLIIDIDEDVYKKIVADKYAIYDKMFYSIKKGTPIPDNATVCDIDAIRADIEAARYGLINDGLDVAARIIDKYIEGRK